MKVVKEIEIEAVMVNFIITYVYQLYIIYYLHKTIESNNKF